jgi:hypothetical protein
MQVSRNRSQGPLSWAKLEYHASIFLLGGGFSAKVCWWKDFFGSDVFVRFDLWDLKILFNPQKEVLFLDVNTP